MALVPGRTYSTSQLDFEWGRCHFFPSGEVLLSRGLFSHGLEVSHGHGRCLFGPVMHLPPAFPLEFDYTWLSTCHKRNKRPRLVWRNPDVVLEWLELSSILDVSSFPFPISFSSNKHFLFFLRMRSPLSSPSPLLADDYSKVISVLMNMYWLSRVHVCSPYTDTGGWTHFISQIPAMVATDIAPRGFVS